jgi:dihydrofolate reductase
MRKVVLQLFVSLDGHSEPVDDLFPAFGTPYWVEADREQSKTGAAYRSVDCILMGSGLYREWSRYWPTAGKQRGASKWLRDGARWMNETPKVVFSKSLKNASWSGTRIVRSDPAKEIRRLKRLRGKNMIVLGGARLPRFLVEHNLVDEYVLTVSPVVLGRSGPGLYGRAARPRPVKLLRAHRYSNGATLQHFVPTR